MRVATCVFMVVSMLVVHLDTVGADSTTIRWPAPGLRDLQSAIDVAPDGATIQVAPGVYEISQPIFVHQRLTVVGAGSGLTGPGQVTSLMGPTPQPVVDERGQLVLLATDVKGLFNVIGAGAVTFKDIQLSGFDAGIVGKNDAGGNAAPIAVENVVITNTGRGILFLSTANLTVRDCIIANTLWHGISVAPQLGGALLIPVLQVADAVIVNPAGAGIYFAFVAAHIEFADILGARAGGIVGFHGQAGTSILDSFLLANTEFGIQLFDTADAEIGNNRIVDTFATADGNFGTGVTVFSSEPAVLLSKADLHDNQIDTSALDGVLSFASDVTLQNDLITCSTFDLDVESVGGVLGSFEDGGGNLCGCPDAVNSCVVSSSQVLPPKMVGGLQ